jgi:hypothetical protein
MATLATTLSPTGTFEHFDEHFAEIFSRAVEHPGQF